MKNTKILLTALSLAIIGSSTANAAPFDWRACNAETAKFCPTEKNDEKIWACLQAHDADLSVKCDTQHSVYEVKTGKTQ